MINLLNLHSEKDGPNSWIWVSLEPYLIKKIYSSLLNDSTQDDIGRKISKKLNAGFSTIVKHLIRIKRASDVLEIPLPLIIELNNLSGKNHLQGMLDSIISLKCKNYNSQSVKPIHKIDVTLAKIMGTHVSDGYLQKNREAYAWKVTEGRKDLIDKLKVWIKDVFGFDAITWYYSRDNLWVCSTKNKIFCRFLEKIVGFPVGKKSHHVKEPEIIRKADLKIRNAFLAGVLNFDGCVKTNGNISLTSMSKELIEDIREILYLNGIRTNVTFNTKKESWQIESTSSRNVSYLKKWSKFFEINTYKYNRLKFFVSPSKNYPINYLLELFPKEKKSKISLHEIFNSSKKLKKFGISDLLKELSKVDKNPSKTSLYKYLFILEKSSILNKMYEYVPTDKSTYKMAVYTFNG